MEKQNNESHFHNKDSNEDSTQAIQQESQISKSESKTLSSSDESSSFLSSKIITHKQYLKKKKLDLKKKKNKENSLKNKKVKVKKNKNVEIEVKRNSSVVSEEIKPELNNSNAAEDENDGINNEENNTENENEEEEYSNNEAEVDEDVSEITVSEDTDKPIKINLKRDKVPHTKKVYNWILEGKCKSLKTVVRYLSEIKTKSVNIVSSYEWDDENEDYDIKIFIKLKRPQEISFFDFSPLYMTLISHAGVNYKTIKENIEQYGESLYKYSDGMEHNYVSTEFLIERRRNFERMNEYLGRKFNRNDIYTDSKSKSDTTRKKQEERYRLQSNIGRKLGEMKKEALKLYKMLDEEEKYYESE